MNDSGATIGAIVGSALLVGWAWVAWPWTWSEAERRHHELAAIWAEARADAATTVPWERAVAWARADQAGVVLERVTCEAGGSVKSLPSAFHRERVETLAADDVEAAAAAMEHLREELASRETASRTAYETSLAAAAEQAREQRLLKLEQAADADVRRHADAAEQALQRDQAAAEAAEAADRAAQAAAVARALRKP